MANYKALDTKSQGIANEVLYFDQDVAPTVLFECIYNRLEAVEHLHSELIHLGDSDVRSKPISEVTAILLSDVKVMFWKTYDHAKSLKDAQKEIAEHKNTINALNEIINQLRAGTSTEGKK